MPMIIFSLFRLLVLLRQSSGGVVEAEADDRAVAQQPKGVKRAAFYQELNLNLVSWLKGNRGG